MSVSCSSARPSITRVFGGAQTRRKSHLRPVASSRVTSRSGSDAASGIPGTPPPEPTSTIDPANACTRSRPRSESSSSAVRASSTSLIAVRPGVSTSALIQSSSNRMNDDVAVGLGALARRLHAVELLQAQMHHLAFDRRHRLEIDRLVVGERSLCGTHRKRLERDAPAVAIARRVDDDLLAILGMTSPHDGVREVLDRVDRLTMAADEHAQVHTRARDRDGFVTLLHVDVRAHSDSVHDSGDELPRFCGELRLVYRLGLLLRRRVGGDGRYLFRRREADTEKPALALRHHLEAHGRLVETRLLLLELAQRRPLGLADRLAGCLDP